MRKYTITCCLFLSYIQYLHAIGSCLSYNVTFLVKLKATCAGAVDYPFFLPEDKTLSQLEEDVILANNRILSNPTMKSFTTACQQSLRNMICASVYLKCQPDVNLTDINTYNSEIYSNNPLPFQRPCVSICADVNNQCTGIYQVANTMPNCAAVLDYGHGAVRKYSSNATACFVPHNASVAESEEEYIYKDNRGVCSGLVETLYVPAGDRFDPSYAVLQEPYAVQRQIEAQLRTGLRNLPPWIEPTCKLALLKYLCSTVYLKPQTTTLLKAVNDSDLLIYANAINSFFPTLLSSTFVIPSFTNRSVCTNYAKTCALFIVRANNSMLTPHCDSLAPAVGALSILRFPSKRQVVAQVQPTLLPITIKFYSDPNPMDLFDQARYNQSYTAVNADGEETTSCPTGYVEPEHPEMDQTQKVVGTVCAVACAIPEWTSDEWERFERQSIAIPLVGAILSALLMVTFVTKINDLRDNYLVMLFTALSFVAAVASAVLNNRPFEDRFCFDNSINSSQKVQTSSLCIIQGVILSYTLLASCAICFAMIVDVFLKLKEWHDLFNHRGYVAAQLLFVLGLPVIPVVVAGQMEVIGFSKTQPFCLVMSTPFAPENLDIALLALPILIVTGLTIIVFILVLIEWCGCCRRSSNKVVDGGEATDSLDRVIPYRHRKSVLYHTVPAVLFVFVMFTVWLGFLVSKIVFYLRHEEFQDSFRAWTQCMFREFRGSDEDAWAVCGHAPEKRPATTLTTWLIVCLTGKSIVVAVVYLVVWAVRFIYPPDAEPEQREKKSSEDGAAIPTQAVPLKDKPIAVGAGKEMNGSDMEMRVLPIDDV